MPIFLQLPASTGLYTRTNSNTNQPLHLTNKLWSMPNLKELFMQELHAKVAM